MIKQRALHLNTPSARATRRQHKHELWLTFLNNATGKKPDQLSAPVKPRLLRTLLSLFV
jgi:hypothetical protein